MAILRSPGSCDSLRMVMRPSLVPRTYGPRAPPLNDSRAHGRAGALPLGRTSSAHTVSRMYGLVSRLIGTVLSRRRRLQLGVRLEELRLGVAQLMSDLLEATPELP